MEDESEETKQNLSQFSPATFAKSPKLAMIYEEIDVDVDRKKVTTDLEKTIHGFSTFGLVRNTMLREMYDKDRELLDKNVSYRDL